MNAILDASVLREVDGKKRHSTHMQNKLKICVICTPIELSGLASLQWKNTTTIEHLKGLPTAHQVSPTSLGLFSVY